jgi:hypothetical protein
MVVLLSPSPRAASSTETISGTGWIVLNRAQPYASGRTGAYTCDHMRLDAISTGGGEWWCGNGSGRWL